MPSPCLVTSTTNSVRRLFKGSTSTFVFLFFCPRSPFLRVCLQKCMMRTSLLIRAAIFHIFLTAYFLSCFRDTNRKARFFLFVVMTATAGPVILPRYDDSSQISLISHWSVFDLLNCNKWFSYCLLHHLYALDLFLLCLVHLRSG